VYIQKDVSPMVQFVVSSIAGSLVVAALCFYLAQIAREQREYLAALLRHPFHLVRGHWVCPRCLGSPNPEQPPIDVFCWFCLRYQQTATHPDRMPFGYVSWHYFRREWDWRQWQPLTQPFTIPKP
jgi:hypothetical protein